MTEPTPPKPTRPEPALSVAVFGFAFLLALFPLQSLDVWWQMAHARELTEGRGLPYENRYSFSHPEYEAISTHWLFGVAAYGLHSVTGPSGLVMAKAAIVGITFLLAYLLARRRGAGAIAAVVLIALAVVAARTRFLERPHIFTMLGLLGAAWAIQLHREGTTRPLWGVPAGIVLWTNIHPGVLFGIGVIGMEAVAEVLLWLREVSRHGRESTEAQQRLPGVKRLVAVSALCLLAAMVSPTGWHVYAYNLWHIDLDSVVPLVEFRTTLPQEYPFFYLIAVLSVVLCVIGRKDVRLADAMVLVVFGVLGIRAVRCVANFVLLAVPVVGPQLSRFVSSQEHRARIKSALDGARRVPLQAVGVALLVLPVLGHFTAGERGKYRIGLGISRNFLPQGAASFVLENIPNERMFNGLSSGGYLIWHWYPMRRVFIDGRTNAHPPDLLRRLYKHRVTDGLIRSVVSEYGMDSALLHFRRGVNPFWPHFDLDRWAVVYAEDAALVLLMRTPRNRPLIDKLENRLGPKGFETLSRRLGAHGDDGIRPAYSAASAALELEGRLGANVFSDSVRSSLLVKIAHGYRLAGRGEEAIASYREALSLAPESSAVRTNLGWALLDTGEYRQAAEQFEAALQSGPRRPELLLGLGDCRLAAGEREEAKALFLEVSRDASASEKIRKQALDRLGE